MKRDRLMQLWERVDGELRAALAVLDRVAPPEGDRWTDAQDFIEHNEFGVAFATIVDAVLEADAPDDARQALVHLECVQAEWGTVDDEDGWQMLCQRFS
jgi:hypothetical protein